MMNLNSATERLNSLGYHKSTAAPFVDGNMTIIDFQKGRKGLGMVSLYVNQYGSVEYAEKTAIKWDSRQKRNVPDVSRVYNLDQLR